MIELSPNATDFSYGIRYRLDTITRNKHPVGRTDTTANCGWKLRHIYQAGNDIYAFDYRGDGTTYSCRVDASATNAPDADYTTGEWIYGGYSYDAGTEHECVAGIGASASANWWYEENDTDPATDEINTCAGAGGSLGFAMPDPAAGRLTDGLVDGFWFDNEKWSRNAHCKACSCGLDGSLCTHNGTSWISKGNSDTECGGCLGNTMCVNTAAPSNCT